MASYAVLRRISRCAQLNRMMSTATSRARPWLMLPPAVDGRGNVAYTFYMPATNHYMVNKRKKMAKFQLIPPDIAIDDVKFAGSSHGWIAFSQWSNPGHLFLSDPITERHIRLPPPPRTLFCTAPERVILSSPISNDKCMAFMIFGSPRRGRLAFCRPSQTGSEWTRMGELDDVYENILYSPTHKRLFCICHKNYSKNIVIDCWDVSDNNNTNNNAPALDWVIDNNCELNWGFSPEFPTMYNFKRKCVQMSYLVCAEDSGELFLVVRHVNPRAAPYGEGFCVVDQVIVKEDDTYTDEVDFKEEDAEDDGISGIPYKTVDFDVYKIDTETGEVMYMENWLQGMAMFVGMSHPVAIAAAEAAGLKPDSIYFTDENRFVEATRLEDGSKSNYGGHDNGIFDYRNKDFSACCDFYPVEHHKIRKILPLPLWFTP